MTDEPDLRSVFRELRARPMPPHHLTPATVLRAGQRVRRNRRVAAVAASAAAAVVLTVGFAVTLDRGSGPAPGPDPYRPAEHPTVTVPVTPTVPVPRATPTPSPIGPERTAPDSTPPVTTTYRSVGPASTPR